MDRYRIITPFVKGRIYKVTDTRTDVLQTIKKIRMKMCPCVDSNILVGEGENGKKPQKVIKRNVKKRKSGLPTSSLMLDIDDDDEDDEDETEDTSGGRSVGGITAETLREISILRFLGKHENIITLKDVHTEPEKNRLFLVYEFLDYNLRDYYRNHEGAIAMNNIRSIATQILRGVLHCHVHGVMHRDITPRNIMVTSEGVVKLVNFEASRAFVPPVRTFSHEGFSIWYCAPEILLGRKAYGLPVDIWAVATVLAELVNKYPLFPGDSEIDELYLLFKLLGTPSEESWSGVTTLQDWNPMFPIWRPTLLDRKLPTLPGVAIDFLQRMLILNPCERISAKDALRHPFLTQGTCTAPTYTRNDIPIDVVAAKVSDDVSASSSNRYNLRSKKRALGTQ